MKRQGSRKQSTIFFSFTKKVKDLSLLYNANLWQSLGKGHLDSVVWCKNRVVGAVVRYRRISVATPNLPRRQTSTLIFETTQELRTLSSVILNCHNDCHELMNNFTQVHYPCLCLCRSVSESVHDLGRYGAVSGGKLKMRNLKLSLFWLL